MKGTLGSSTSSGLGAMQRQSLRTLGRRLQCTPVCAKKGKQGSVKVNKRGKVSSRPGPGWQPAPEDIPQPMQEQMPSGTAAGSSAADSQAQQPQPQPQPQLQQQLQQVQPSQPQLQQRSGGGVLTETPQVVVDRMFRRVITFAGLPVLTGMVLFPVFWYLRVVQKIEYPIWVVYITQALMFGGGLLGISYGILSTSWDPRREGSALGWTELQANLPVLLNRNKDQQN